MNSGTGTFGDIRFSGRAVQQNIIRYDGVEGSAIIDASPGNLNGEVPSPFRLQSSLENVQEFRVESSNYPAEYGTGTGGQITVVSKSGTNRCTARRSSTTASDNFDSPNYFDIAKSPLEPEPVRRLGRPAAQEGPHVPLRQLRGLPPRVGRQHRRSGAERAGVGRAPFRRCCRCGTRSSGPAQ